MARKKVMDKLAQDAAAALAAGMSYGQWKAMQTNRVCENQKEIPEGWLVCKCCGKPFKPKTKRPQLYCEHSCQRQAADERSRERVAQRKQKAEEGN